jgi:hypothetical protein
MRRTWLLTLVLAGACGSDVVNHLPDARLVDATHPADAMPDAAGSGSAVASALEPSPRDHGLEVVVVVTSMVVVIGPVRARRRRDDDDATPRT